MKTKNKTMVNLFLLIVVTLFGASIIAKWYHTNHRFKTDMANQTEIQHGVAIGYEPMNNLIMGEKISDSNIRYSRTISGRRSTGIGFNARVKNDTQSFHNLFIGEEFDVVLKTNNIHYGAASALIQPPLRIGNIMPMHTFQIAGDSTMFWLDMSGDSLVWGGNMLITESAERFIKFCDEYVYSKIDSLEAELAAIRKKNKL